MKQNPQYPGPQHRHPRPLRGKHLEFSAEVLKVLKMFPRGRAVPITDREGIYVHGFICGRCGLHFNLYSWQANRHTAANVTCPECKGTGNFGHYRVCLAESPTFLGGGREICTMVPRSGSQMMDDTDAGETAA